MEIGGAGINVSSFFLYIGGGKFVNIVCVY